MSTTLKISYLNLQHATPAYSPTLVTVDQDFPVAVYVTWGDRERSADDLVLYTAVDASGVKVEVGRDGIRAYTEGRYRAEVPAWALEMPAVRRAVIEAAKRAEAERPEVSAACAEYRAILDSIDRERKAQRQQWTHDAVAIARAFRRRYVQIGEQTVPGKHCVRSKHGNLLGYALCWNGRWLGRIERL